MPTIVLFVLALISFAFKAAGVKTAIDLDAAGKAFVVGALVAYLV